MSRELSKESSAIRDDFGRKIYAHIASNKAGAVRSFSECYVTATLEEYTLKRTSITNVTFLNDMEDTALTIENIISMIKNDGLKYRWNECAGRILTQGVRIEADYDGVYGKGKVLIFTDSDSKQSYIFYIGKSISEWRM